MKKRMIALFLTLAMLVPFTPAVAADDNVPRPTVEEILSEYHQKAFEAEATQQTGGAPANSRSVGNSGKTLEQETVDTLNAAGYEAYNLTSENYETLEAQLQTDFADMGLDPDGSYIITISGEEDSASNHARGPNPNVGNAQAPDGGGGSSYFSHTYNGETYYMRYMTVVPTDDSPTKRDFIVAVNRSDNLFNWGVLFDAVLLYAIDSMTEYEEFISMYSLVSDFTEDNDISVMDCGDFMITGCTAWTQQYIQVYNFYTGEWCSSQCSEYAVSRLDSTVYHYDPDTQTATKIDKYLGHNTVYSDFYNDTTTRRNFAADAFMCGTRTLDYTWDISYKVFHPDSGNNYFISGTDEGISKNGYVFTQDHWAYYV